MAEINVDGFEDPHFGAAVLMYHDRVAAGGFFVFGEYVVERLDAYQRRYIIKRDGDLLELFEVTAFRSAGFLADLLELLERDDLDGADAIRPDRAERGVY